MEWELMTGFSVDDYLLVVGVKAGRVWNVAKSNNQSVVQSYLSTYIHVVAVVEASASWSKSRR